VLEAIFFLVSDPFSGAKRIPASAPIATPAIIANVVFVLLIVNGCFVLKYRIKIRVSFKSLS
jgi:hypothetical protein